MVGRGLRTSWKHIPNTGLYKWHTEVNHQFNVLLIQHPKTNLTFAVILLQVCSDSYQKFAEECADVKLDGQYMVTKIPILSLAFTKEARVYKQQNTLQKRGCILGNYCL